MHERRVEPWVLAATIVGSSMVFIDGTVVNVALPVLQSDLSASVAEVQWIVEAYSLFLSALILVGGSLGDHLGRRRVFAVGTVVFTVASVACGFAPNALWLILARAAQGIGGALLTPGSLAIISATFPEERRGQAIGTWSGFSAMTTAIGPVLGGWLVEHVSWRAVFLLNVPLAVVVLAITLWRVPESRDERAARLDWWGALLATLGLGGMVYGLVESSNLGVSHPLVLGSVAVGIVVFGAFLVVESRVREPMMPLDLFRSQTFTGANLLTLLLYGSLSGALFFLPFNLIQIHGYSPTAAGSALLPFVLFMFGLSRWSGGLVQKVGPRLPLVVGPTIVAVATIVFALPDQGGSYWTTFFPGIVLYGLGMAITVAPLTTVVMGSVDVGHAGLASGINNAVSRTGGLLAIAVMGIVVLTAFNAQLDSGLAPLSLSPDVRQAIDAERVQLAAAQVPPGVDEATARAIREAIVAAFLGGYRVAIILCSAMALAAGMMALLLIEDRRPVEREQPATAAT